MKKNKLIILTVLILTTLSCSDLKTQSRPNILIIYADGTEELYDHSKDPNEWYNIAGEKEHRATIEKMKKYIPKKNAEQVNNLKH